MAEEAARGGVSTLPGYYLDLKMCVAATFSYGRRLGRILHFGTERGVLRTSRKVLL